MSSRSCLSSPLLAIVSAAAAAVGASAILAFTIHQSSRRKKKSNQDQKHQKQKSNDNRQQRGRSSDGETRSRFRQGQAVTSSSKVVCCPSAGEFHKCIDTFVTPENANVLVICGTNNNKSSDGGAARVTAAAKRPPVYTFQGSIWDSIHALLQELHGVTIDVICLEPGNMHGNDLLCDCLALIRLLQSLFHPTAILAKSKLLARHARSFHNVHNFINAGGISNAVFQKTGDVQVVCAVGVESYRDTIPFVVREGDHVLEIGCHHGKTTAILAKATSAPNTVVGIDIGKVCIDQANKKYGGSHIRFQVADAWDTATLMSYEPHYFNAIYLDVGGISGADGEFEALSLVRQLVCAYGGFGGGTQSHKTSSSLRCIVVKSRCLRDHAMSWQHSDDLLRS